jgi:hypothetical protein
VLMAAVAALTPGEGRSHQRGPMQELASSCRARVEAGELVMGAGGEGQGLAARAWACARVPACRGMVYGAGVRARGAG